MAELSAIFRDAALALEDPAVPEARDREATELLAWLGCPRPDPPDAEARHRARLLRAASGFRRIFRLVSEAAPGFACLGAEIDPAAVAAKDGLPVTGVAGGGIQLLDAFERCAGEGIERLSCMEATGDSRFFRPPPPSREPWLAAHPGLADEPDWLPAQRLTGDGAEILLPAGLCRWRPLLPGRASPPFAASIGCAAGPTMEAAMLSGLCEVAERDAAALWWHGGQRGRPLPLEAAAEAAAMLVRFRHGATRPRRSWLLDLTTDLGIPAVAAISSAPDGGGICIGTAAHPRRGRAASSALREMALNELAVQLAEAKRAAQGEAALNEADRGHLRRSTGLHAARHPILHPLGAPVEAPAEPAASDAPASSDLAWLLGLLAAAGQEVLAVDLTRSTFGVPAVKMLCLGLEYLPSHVKGRRLEALIGSNGMENRPCGIFLM